MENYNIQNRIGKLSVTKIRKKIILKELQCDMVQKFMVSKNNLFQNHYPGGSNHRGLRVCKDP